MKSERWKHMRDLEPGDMIALVRPDERALVVSGRASMQIERDDMDRKIGEREGWLLIFEYRTGAKCGRRDHVIGLPEWKVRLA